MNDSGSKGIDSDQRQIIVRDGKGMEDRVTTLPESLEAALERHLRSVKTLHERDLALGHGAVYLPYALERKYPNVDREWGWQFVFPSTWLSLGHATGTMLRCTLPSGGRGLCTIEETRPESEVLSMAFACAWERDRL